MNITIIGSGYVGLVTGLCLSEMGNHVCCLDINENLIERLNKGELHIFEPGLETILRSSLSKNTVYFTSSIKKAITTESEIVFIAVGTPSKENGSTFLEYVFQAAENIGKNLSSEVIVVNKSTAPVGTAEKIKKIITQELKKRNMDIPFDVISNPEFLREGKAVKDFMKPSRIILGSNNQKSIQKMKNLYSGLISDGSVCIVMDPHSAELTKYAANAFLAVKVSFINEISNIAERVNADIDLVRIGIGYDPRIGQDFIYPGCGYGGSCLPKDVKSLYQQAATLNYEAKLIKAAEDLNETQKLILVNKVIAVFGEKLAGKKIAVWGLSFKADTCDMREAPSITIINELAKRGAEISAYDPEAIEQAKEYLRDNTNVSYYDDKYATLNGANCMLLITDWKEFKQPNFKKMKENMLQYIIFDGRNQYNKKELDRQGFKYFPIGSSVD